MDFNSDFDLWLCVLYMITFIKPSIVMFHEKTAQNLARQLSHKFSYFLMFYFRFDSDFQFRNFIVGARP